MKYRKELPIMNLNKSPAHITHTDEWSFGEVPDITVSK